MTISDLIVGWMVLMCLGVLAMLASVALDARRNYMESRYGAEALRRLGKEGMRRD